MKIIMPFNSSALQRNSIASSASNHVWPLLMCSSTSILNIIDTWTSNGSVRRMPANLRIGRLKCMPQQVSHSEPARADVFVEEHTTENNISDQKIMQKQALTNDTEVTQRIETIRTMLSSMENGEISVAAYDTAWVALIENIEKPGVPQFPSSLEWIVMNQLEDGSWGDRSVFLAHDRILSTLACVVALKKWNSHPEKIQKGLKFIMENMEKLEGEDIQHMPAGFEFIIPSLLKMAKALGMAEVADMPCIQHIYAKRELKMVRIPWEVLHNIPTTLLFSLEGMEGLDWTKLLKLRCEDGSFISSIASTAFALMQTKDEKCLNYLQNIVDKFKSGVPSFYPLSIFERLWAVDKVERLGISRHFQAEIMDCLRYVHRYWNEKGLSWTEPSPIKDLDNTVMGFRLLRLYGFEVSPDVVKYFQKGDEFMCFEGQMVEGPTVMLNLYRASQVQFPGEIILEEARKYSFDFLRCKRACGEIFDKWMILKDLPGEVGYALDVPWYASLPRLEARVFIDQYGGDDDACIAKNIYRLPRVMNSTNLELAKLDYNNCQAIHQLELRALEMWYEDNKILRVFGISDRDVLVSYYLAAASIFEPERCVERLAWAKSSILVESIISYFHSFKNSSGDTCKKTFFLDEFLSRFPLINETSNATRISSDSHDAVQELVFCLLGFLRNLLMDLQEVTRAESLTLFGQAWKKWLLSVDYRPEIGGYVFGDEAELLVQIISICSRGSGRSDTLSSISLDHNYAELSSVTNGLSTQLRTLRNKQFIENRNLETGGDVGRLSSEIESGMQRVVQLVLVKSPSDELGGDIKKLFLTLVRSFYYMAYFDPKTVDQHISKVLFEPIE